MKSNMSKVTLIGFAIGINIAGPAAAGGDGFGSGNTDIFTPPRVYVTPPATVLTYTSPSSTGIPYRWNVTLGSRGQAIFGYYVGAKSWWEPSNPPATPGWTHNSNWVALTLTSGAWVTIKVGPSVPVPCAPPSQPASCDATGRTGSDLYPALSLYSGHDTTSAQDHVFNPVGNGWWSTVQYKDSSYRADRNSHVLTYQKWLPAGSYTINIGGAGAKSPHCSSSSPCYSGGQSYQAQISTSPWN